MAILKMNQFCNEMIAKQSRLITLKQYDSPTYVDELHALASGLGRPTAAVRAIRLISILDRAFDQVLLNTFVLGAKLTGGRK